MGHPSKTKGANGKGSNPGHVGRSKHGRMELHVGTSAAAASILGGSGKGQVETGKSGFPNSRARNTSDGSNVGKTMGSDYTAGNINTGSKR